MENKPYYQAHSSTTKEEQAASSTSFRDRFPYIETPSDTLLVIPILHSGLTPDDTPVCLHLIHLEGGTLGLCNTPTDQACPCCMNAVCNQHQSQCYIDLPHDFVPLCETCAALKVTQRHALHHFVTSHVEVHV